MVLWGKEGEKTENNLLSKFLKNESGSTVFNPQSLGQLKWKYIHAFFLYTVYLACNCWTLDSFSRAFLSWRVEFSVYSGFQNCYLLLRYRVFSFQWSVIVNLLLRVSRGVKTAREKPELHTAIKAGKYLNNMEMIRCLKISGLRNTLPFDSL